MLERRQFTKSAAAAIVAVGSSNALAQQPAAQDDSWQPPSRAQLFRTELVEPWNKTEGKTTGPQGLAIPSTFTFPLDAKDDTILKKPRENSIFGLDVSGWTSDLSFDQLLQQRVSFVYAKATQGVTYKDKKFGGFWKAMGDLAPANKIRRGPYHFLSASTKGEAQADSFVDFLSLHGGLKSGDLPPVIDLEWDVTKDVPDNWVGKGKQYIIDNALACLNRVKQRTGRTPFIYTAKSWFGSQTMPLADYDVFKDFPLWVADYNPKRKLDEKPAFPGSVKPALWQFTDQAKLTTGYSGGLDASIFYGTESDFKSAFGLS